MSPYRIVFGNLVISLLNLNIKRLKLIFGCNFQNSINENEMNFQYLEDLDSEFMTSSFDLNGTVLSLNENSTEKSSCIEEKAKEI